MALDWGGAMSGATGGAAMGSSLGPWGSVLGGIGGALGGLFGGKEGTGPTYMEYDPDKQYRDSMMPLWNQNVAYDQDTMRNLQQGLLNSGMEKSLSAMEKEKRRQLYNQYFGSAGNRGGTPLGGAYEAGALSGIGPKAMNAQANKVYQDYAFNEQGIGDIYNQMRFQGLQNLQNQYGAGGAATSYKSATATPQMIRTGEGSQASNPIASILGSIGGNWLGGLGGQQTGIQGGTFPTNAMRDHIDNFGNYSGSTYAGATPYGYSSRVQKF